MKIGASIFLIAVGAIMAFALRFDSSKFDLRIVGWVLMVAGVIGLVVTVMLRKSVEKAPDDVDTLGT